MICCGLQRKLMAYAHNFLSIEKRPLLVLTTVKWSQDDNEHLCYNIIMWLHLEATKLLLAFWASSQSLLDIWAKDRKKGADD